MSPRSKKRITFEMDTDRAVQMMALAKKKGDLDLSSYIRGLIYAAIDEDLKAA